MASTLQNANIEFFDSVCKSILLASTSVASSIFTSPIAADILQTQLQIVHEQRAVMADKINAKFRVTGCKHDVLVPTDDKFTVQKFIASDPIFFEQDKPYSCRDHFNSSDEIRKISFLIRQTIEEDLVVAHAKNVSTLSGRFNNREVRELEEFFLKSDADRHDDTYEKACTLDDLKGNEKIVFFDLDALELGDECLFISPGSTGIVEQLEYHINEALYNAETVLKLQHDIMRNVRDTEANGTMMAAIDIETAATDTYFPKFVTAPNLEYYILENTASSGIQSDMLGFCASFMMQVVEENSLIVTLPDKPILVCSDYGIQNYHSLVETCTPIRAPYDDSEDFSLVGIEAFPHELYEDIKVSTVSEMNRSICEIIAANLEESWKPVANTNERMCGEENRRISGKRRNEFDSPDSKMTKKTLCEMVNDQNMLDSTETKRAFDCEGTKPLSEAVQLYSSENEERLSESIPNSNHSDQNPFTASQLHTPPAAASDHSQIESQNIHGGLKMFVSEMLINQRALYLELVSRISEKATKIHICETSLELPDVTFSATSCALVFSSSELWDNIQNSPVDFPDTLQEILRLLSEAGFIRCMLLLHTQNDASYTCPLGCQMKGWVELLLRNHGIAVDVLQVASISDAVDVICAVSERDTEHLDPVAAATSANVTTEQEIIDILSHVPQLRNPHVLANCAALLAQHDDGLGLFLMDAAWRRAVLEGMLGEFQMQSIDECMREVAAQMQAQISQQQQYEVTHEHRKSVNPQVRYDQSSALDQAEGEQYDPTRLFAGDVLFQVNELPTIKKRRADKETQWGRKNSDHCEQLQQHNHESAVEFPGTAANGAVEDVKVGKRASTLKYEQRSGSSQCQLAWNVPGKQQRTESVTDIHLQMMAPADLIEIESRAGLRDNMARHWENGGSAKDCGNKGGERWLPLQNSKERLMALKRTSLQRDMGKGHINQSWYANPQQQQQKRQQQLQQSQKPPYAKKVNRP